MKKKDGANACVLKYACADPFALDVDKVGESCAQCPNRMIQHTPQDAKCVLKHCPADMPLRGESYACYPCDFPLGINVGQKESFCDKCPQRELKITPDKTGCVLKQCPLEFPLRLDNGSCTQEQKKNTLLAYGDYISSKIGHFLLDLLDKIGFTALWNTYIVPLFVRLFELIAVIAMMFAVP